RRERLVRRPVAVAPAVHRIAGLARDVVRSGEGDLHLASAPGDPPSRLCTRPPQAASRSVAEPRVCGDTPRRRAARLAAGRPDSVAGGARARVPAGVVRGALRAAVGDVLVPHRGDRTARVAWSTRRPSLALAERGDALARRP